MQAIAMQPVPEKGVKDALKDEDREAKFVSLIVNKPKTKMLVVETECSTLPLRH